MSFLQVKLQQILLNGVACCYQEQAPILRHMTLQPPEILSGRDRTSLCSMVHQMQADRHRCGCRRDISSPANGSKPQYKQMTAEAAQWRRVGCTSSPSRVALSEWQRETEWPRSMSGLSQHASLRQSCRIFKASTCRCCSALSSARPDSCKHTNVSKALQRQLLPG